MLTKIILWLRFIYVALSAYNRVSYSKHGQWIFSGLQNISNQSLKKAIKSSCQKYRGKMGVGVHKNYFCICVPSWESPILSRSLAAVWTHDISPSEKVYGSPMQPTLFISTFTHIPFPGQKTPGPLSMIPRAPSLSLIVGLNIRIGFQPSTYCNCECFTNEIIAFFLTAGIMMVFP